MASVGEVKTPPFRPGKRAQNGMFGDGSVGRKAALAFCDYSIHAFEVQYDLLHDLLQGCATRQGAFRRLPS